MNVMTGPIGTAGVGLVVGDGVGVTVGVRVRVAVSVKVAVRVLVRVAVGGVGGVTVAVGRVGDGVSERVAVGVGG